MRVVRPGQSEGKLKRIRQLLKARGRRALILASRDNVAWFSCGEWAPLVEGQERGRAVLVITADVIYLIASAEDGGLPASDELRTAGAELMLLRWQDESCEARARRVVRGLRALCDVPLRGTEEAGASIARLHYPLSALEIERCRRLGATTESVLARIAQQVRPGMRERDLEALCLWESTRAGIRCDAVEIGGGRPGRAPSAGGVRGPDRKVHRLVVLRLAVRLDGLRAKVSRAIWLGDRLPPDVTRAHEAACRIEAATIASCLPDRTLRSVLEARQEACGQMGCADVWSATTPGGLIGYRPTETSSCLCPGEPIGRGMAFAWSSRVDGLAVEELCLVGERGPEIATVRGHWPARGYECSGRLLSLPDILRR